MSVLLVDDEVGIRSRVRAQLQDQGMHVSVAATVAEAEAALALRSFVVVILELTLPDGSGLDVLDHLQAAGSSAHVIMVSGSTAEADRVRALERGADDFVVKPFYLRELTARVLAVRRRRDDEAAARLVGAASPGHVVGRHLTELVAPTSVSAARDGLIETGAGSYRRSELMNFQQGDSDEVTAAVESTPAIWHGQPARHLRLTPVADARARLRWLAMGVLGDLSDAIIIADLHFHIRSWNSAAERLYGWMEDEVQGRHILDVLRWVGDREQIPEMWERLEYTGRWHGESTQLTRDGSKVEILSSTTLIRDTAGEPVGIVSVNRSAVDARRSSAREQDATLVARLRQGLADDEFQVHYQPIVDLLDGRPIALEALVRWEHPERGTLLPGEFLDSAEHSGLIVELGERVLDKACRQAADWRRSGADIHLSINVSTRQLTDPAMVERFTTIVRDSGFDPGCLWLELTETAMVEELENAGNVLRRLVDLGVGVSIDDFGTGWASLTYLRSFPVHALKIDRSFVARAGRTANDTAIVRSVLSLGAELDLFVVAEGIETQAQLDELKRLGCSFGQGYHLGRPTAACDVPVERAHRIRADALVPGGASAADGDVLTTPSSTGAAHRDHHGLATRYVAPSPHRLPRTTPSSTRPGLPGTNAEAFESDVVANLLRGLLRVTSAPAAADLLHRTIRGLGGCLVPAAEAGEEVLPVDVSLGEGPPMLVEVERFSVARMQLERLLPRLVEDARQAVGLLRQTERLVEEAARDELTGLANRRVLDRVLPRATSGSVVLIDLDHFKEVNDRHGHAAGDAVLVSFGKVLTAQIRAQDTSCRIGGEEFALVLTGADISGAVELVDRVRTTWSAAAPRAVTFSAGVAAIGADGGVAALLAADRALYEAKGHGRDRTELATRVDQQEL